MGVDLALEHPVLELELAPLVLDAAVHQCGDLSGQAVDSAADDAELVGSVYRAVLREVAVLYSPDTVRQAPDRPVYRLVQIDREYCRYQQHDDADGDREDHGGGCALRAQQGRRGEDEVQR